MPLPRYRLDRPWIVTVTLADGLALTTTIYAPTPTEAEDLSRTPTVAGVPVARIVVRSVGRG